MKSMRFVGTVAVALGLALPLAGTALATDATLNTTGPNSNQSVKVDNSTDVNSTNINVTSTDNVNEQTADTGKVAAADNTSVSSSDGSGAAANNASAGTAVTNTNEPVVSVQGGSVPGGQGGNSEPAGCGCTQQGGSVLGASTSTGLGAGSGSVATLPQVGASVPVDVSALRNAWHAQTAAPTTALVQQTRGITNVMLGVAAGLSLLGGLGSAAYTRRKQRRV